MEENKIYMKPKSFPVYLEPFGDMSLSMAARGVFATLSLFRHYNLHEKELFYETYKGPVQELIKKGYLFVYKEFGDDPEIPDEDNNLIHDISASPMEIRAELNSKEYSKILSDAIGITWDTKIFCVHHINHDRKDNSLENLLLLPQKLHKRYHYLEFQTKKLREELSYEGIASNLLNDRNKIFSFLYTVSEMAEMKKVQENIINVKKYCDANGKDFNASDMFVASNHEIIQKYA